MKDRSQIEGFSKLPGVDKLLECPEISQLVKENGHDAVVCAIRKVLDNIRKKLKNGVKEPTVKHILSDIKKSVKTITGQSFKRVINATGVVIHTNLGRAPLGKKILSDVQDIITGYSNLEYDLTNACRGKRDDHIRELIAFLTHAEDAIVVNNNAAAIILTLNTLAYQRDVIISRGELIEIGGSFRIPEIMAASGAIMVEIGTTNRTKIEDYENAIGEKTAVLFKAHKSNFSMRGFTKEASIRELSNLGGKYSLPVIYDLGSGLLRKPEALNIKDEPDVKKAIEDGADLVTFSCDKLLGGPQAGIIAGKESLIKKLSSAPMMRAIRVGKITLAFLTAACRYYLDDDTLIRNKPIFEMLERSTGELHAIAKKITKELEFLGVDSIVTDSIGRCGGGTLPDLAIKSYAVMLKPCRETKKGKSLWAEEIFNRLHALDQPIVGVLRKGNVIFDVLTIFKEDIPYITMSIARVVKNVNSMEIKKQ